MNGEMVAKNWWVEGVRDHEPDGTRPHKISRTFNVQDAAAVFADLAKTSDCSKRPDLVAVRSTRTFRNRHDI